MSVRVVGTCSNCGGPVAVPTFFHSIYPPVPQCRSCGATPKNARGPVIPMNPPPKSEVMASRRTQRRAS